MAQETMQRISARLINGSQKAKRLNQVEKFFNRHKNCISWVHMAMFIVFLIVLFVPLLLPEPSESAKPWEDFTLFSNFLMWAIWFPLVFLSVIFTGRSWCGLLCPMGAASEYANRYGRGIKAPNWIRWEGTPIVAFLIITVIGQTIGVRDHKEAIAELFGGLMLFAIIIGYFYGQKGRVWCRHMCPVGLLLGLYSRLGMINFHAEKPKKGGDTYRDKSICPTMIDILRKKESRHCIECFRCVNPYSPKSMRVSWRKPGEEVESINEHNPNSAEVWFFFLGTGAALGGFLWLILPLYQTFRQKLGEWAVNIEWYWVGESGPSWLMSVHPERREILNWLDFSTIIIFIVAVTIIFSLVMVTLNLYQAYLIKKRVRLPDDVNVFNILAYQYMPVAMIALLIGLGGKIFELLEVVGMSHLIIIYLKVFLFTIAILWSIKIGTKLISRLGLGGFQLILTGFVGAIGSIFVAVCWYPAIFGM